MEREDLPQIAKDLAAEIQLAGCHSEAYSEKSDQGIWSAFIDVDGLVLSVHPCAYNEPHKRTVSRGPLRLGHSAESLRSLGVIAWGDPEPKAPAFDVTKKGWDKRAAKRVIAFADELAPLMQAAWKKLDEREEQRRWTFDFVKTLAASCGGRIFNTNGNWHRMTDEERERDFMRSGGEIGVTAGPLSFRVSEHGSVTLERGGISHDQARDLVELAKSWKESNEEAA